MPISNASLLDLQCTAAEIATWTDNDTGEAVSTSETNAPAAAPMATVWSFDTKTSADTNDKADRRKDIGSIEGLGNRVVISWKTYFDTLGTFANDDAFIWNICRSDWLFYITMASDGFFVHNGTAWGEVGTNLVVQDAWQEWTADITFPGGVVADAVFDLYLDGVLQVSGVDCSYTAADTDGNIILQLRGYTTDNMLVYFDWLKIGDRLIPSSKNAVFFGCNF